jgi:4-hydroxy-3-polyprenylbenzoate decarboxylase
MSSPSRVIVAMTGSSATPYAFRLLEVLRDNGVGVELMITATVDTLCRTELGKSLAETLTTLYGRPLEAGDSFGAAAGGGPLARRHALTDFGAAAASGSGGPTPMVVVPCSMGTLGRIAAGVSDNLITRAADVCLKERRPLVLVPRETPLSAIHLENMLRLTRAGATLLPASPGFYQGSETDALLDFIVQRILKQLGLSIRIQKPWGVDE